MWWCDSLLSLPLFVFFFVSYLFHPSAAPLRLRHQFSAKIHASPLCKCQRDVSLLCSPHTQKTCSPWQKHAFRCKNITLVCMLNQKNSFDGLTVYVCLLSTHILFHIPFLIFSSSIPRLLSLWRNPDIFNSFRKRKIHLIQSSCLSRLSFFFSFSPFFPPALNKQIFKDCLQCIWGGE